MMKRSKASIAITWITCLSLVLSLCAGIILIDVAKAAPGRVHEGPVRSRIKDKVASDLRQQVRRNSGSNTVRTIIRLNDRMSDPLKAMLEGNGIRVKRRFSHFNSLAVELPASLVDSVASFPEVEFASVDGEVRSMGGHVAHTTGADNVRSMGPSGSSLDGSGISIAVLDSGIFIAHDSFDDAQTGQSRVIVSQDFTGEGRTDDPYGHGTHVAAAAAGNGVVSQGRYIGIAPKANLINLRVLNSQGIGTVSALLAALDWVMTNRSLHNIRVVNMSLGMPAVNSYET